MIKYGYVTEQQVENFEVALKELLDKSDFAMQIDQSDLIKYILNGDKRFKTQFETGTSGGLLDTRRRAALAGGLFGHKPERDAVPAKDREKYGFIISKDLSDTNHPALSWYGDCTIRFKKDMLKGKVTYSCWDSLNYQEGALECSAGDIENPSLAGFGGCNPSTLAKIIKKMPKAKTISKAIGYDGGYQDNYFELQYHEDMLTAECIDSIVFPRKPDFACIEKARKLGIKCYYRDEYGDAKPC